MLKWKDARDWDTSSTTSDLGQAWVKTDIDKAVWVPYAGLRGLRLEASLASVTDSKV